MRLQEAQWIERSIDRHIKDACFDNRIVLNLGCGALQSRTTNKPWIEELTIFPLKKKGYEIVCSDIFRATGIDLVGDIFDKAFQIQLESLRPSVIMFCNILEHIPAKKREMVPAILRKIVKPNGFIFVTVPRSYPYHADPIDTLFRPCPDELTRLFESFDLIDSEVINCGSYAKEFRSGSYKRRAKKIVRLLFPLIRPKRWFSHIHRLFWFWKPYLQTVTVFRARSSE
jgi:hypothetical protein